MSVLESVIQLKQMEQRRQEFKSQSMQNAIQMINRNRQNAIANHRNQKIDELSRQNILSQIESRKPSALDQMITRSKAIEASQLIADKTGRQEDVNVFESLIGQGTINSKLETPVAQATPLTTLSGENAADVRTSNNNRLAELGFGLDRTVTGNLTETGKKQQSLKVKQIEADIEIAKQVEAQKQKAGEQTRRAFLGASAITNTGFNAVMRFDNEQFEKYGIKPGDWLGLAAKLTPKQMNQYKAAAEGAAREGAAKVGIALIPNARAVKMVKLFEKSVAEVGNTTEGNANNVAISMGSAFGNAIANNIPMETEDGDTVPIQSITVDPETGLTLTQLLTESTAGKRPFMDYLNGINNVKEKFTEDLIEQYLMSAFNTNPDLLKEETQEMLFRKLPTDQKEAFIENYSRR